jgi:histidinol-phosphatase
VLGVSSASEYGEVAWARRGGGAFLNGEPVRVGAHIDRLAAATVSTGNLKSLARGPGWQTLAQLVQGAHRIRGYGDFLHYHLLARGGLDLVIESDVNILDIAALAVIVREAGGVFTDLDGAPLDLDTRSVLAGTPALHALALPLFAGWRG